MRPGAAPATRPRADPRGQRCDPRYRDTTKVCVSSAPLLPNPSSPPPQPVFAPHIRKFLSQACHLEAKQHGVAEVQQIPQSEEHWRAPNALLQALSIAE